MRARPIRPIRQRNSMDCGIAALAMLTGKSYGDVAYQARRLYPRMPRRGLGLYHLERIAKALGFRLKRVYKRDGGHLIEHNLGILGVIGKGVSWAGHWVLWKESVIIDPDEDRQVWGMEEFLRSTKTRPTTMLVLE